MEPFPLRDCLSATGVNGHVRSMAVGAQGQLVFMKSATELMYYDTHEIFHSTLRLSKKDPLFDDCYFYDFSYLRGGTLAVCLQRPATGELFICEGIIDPQDKTVNIGGTVHETKIVATRGRTVCFLHDEAGVVLISYPIKWVGKDDYIELFHVSNYLSAGSGDKYKISLTTNDKVDATFGNCFISRNHLYMFYGHDYSKFLLVALSGNSCGKCQIRSSQGLPPSDAYMGKTTVVFEEFALIYAYMNIRVPVKPNLYMLNLTNLKWIPLNLTLSHHFPNSKVCLQKQGEELIYMHGDCNVIGCSEKAHLYQINIEPLMGLLNSRGRSQSTGFAFGCLRYPSVSNLVTIPDRRSSSMSGLSCRPSVSSDTPPTTPIENCQSICKSDAPIVQRYKKKQSKDESARRRYSNNLQKSSSTSVDGGDCVKRSPSCSSLHWGADMAEQSGRSLQDQIKLANEMGYGEDVVIAALNLMQGQSDQPYHAFDSTNSMLDFLNQAASRQEPKLKLSVFNESARPDKERQPRAQSVSRSSSFHLGSPRTPRAENHDLFRLIRTLDKEKERDKREVEQQFTRLKTRIHELERDCEHQQREIERLRADNDEHTVELREKNIRIDKMMDEITALRDNCDKEAIKNGNLSKELHVHKELIDHRRKKYDEEQASWQQKHDELQDDLERLSQELRLKSALLDEQTTISRNLEQRNTSLQTGTLLEQIEAKMESRLKMDERIVEENARLRDLFEDIKTKMPELEAAKQRAEAAVEDCERKRREEGESLRREINTLLEKTTSECCICLSTKPNVVFMPCRHLAICQGCVDESPQLTECPACRAKIESTLQIYT